MGVSHIVLASAERLNFVRLEELTAALKLGPKFVPVTTIFPPLKPTTAASMKGGMYAMPV
jgi:hypothetical protein